MGLLLAAVILAARTATAEPSEWLAQQTEHMHRISGRIADHNYGFSVAPPPGAIAYVTNGHDGDHGAVFVLGEGRTIVAYPEYTGFVDGDAQPCGKDRFSQEAGSVRIVTASRLGGRPACMETLSRGRDVWRIVQATGTDRGTGIMYTLCLTTMTRWSRQDFASLDRTARDFRRFRIFP